jgi:hypothetical protein
LALYDLNLFNGNPSPQNASRLLSIPVVFNLLKEEGQGGNPYPEWLLDICRWLFNRGNKILNILLQHDVPLNSMAEVAQDDWETVRTVHSYLCHLGEGGV